MIFFTEIVQNFLQTLMYMTILRFYSLTMIFDKCGFMELEEFPAFTIKGFEKVEICRKGKADFRLVNLIIIFFAALKKYFKV